MGEKARPAVVVLVRALERRGAVQAAESLGKLRMDPTIFIPALDQFLRRRGRLASAEALGKFGKKAAWVAGDLIDALDDSRVRERVTITNALLQILPESVICQAINKREKNTNPSIFRFRAVAVCSGC
jgi:hypothetical protein